MRQVRVKLKSASVSGGDLEILARQIKELSTTRVAYSGRGQSSVRTVVTRFRKTSHKTVATTRMRSKPPRKASSYHIGTALYVAYEQVSAYIATPTGQKLIGACLMKVAGTCLKWVKDRHRKTGKPIRLELYGPNGNVVRTFDGAPVSD